MGWFLVVLVAELMVMAVGIRARRTLAILPSAGLALAIAFSAAGSFRRENETGLLELFAGDTLVGAPTAEGPNLGNLLPLFSSYFCIFSFWRGEIPCSIKGLIPQCIWSGRFCWLSFR